MSQRRAALLAVLLFLAPSRGSAEGEQRAILQLIVNEVDRGETLVVLVGDDVVVPEGDLVAAGIRGLERFVTMRGGDRAVALRAVPFLRFRIDEKALVLRLDVQPTHLEEKRLDLRPARPADIEPGHDSSAFVNYSVQARDVDNVDAFAEAGLVVRRALLFTNATRSADGAIVRGETSLTIDEPGRLRRWVIGDAFGQADLLGGRVEIAGVTVATELAVDPYAFPFAAPSITGVASTPSTVDVYVNGARVRRESLPPGVFELRNLPVLSGAGTTRLVIRDAFGREQDLTQAYYFAPQLLAKGRQDYGYSLGFPRARTVNANWDYNLPVLLARHRVGLGRGVTAGTRLEAGGGLVSVGSSLALGSDLGVLELAGAGSATFNGWGAGAAAGYSYLGRTFGTGANLVWQSGRYANAGLPPEADRAILDAAWFQSVKLSDQVGFTVQFGHTVQRDAASLDRVAATVGVQLGKQATLALSGMRTQSGDVTTYEAFLNLGYFFDNNLNVAGIGTLRDRAPVGTLTATYSSPRYTGFDGNAEVDAGRATEGQAALAYRGRHGRIESTYSHHDGKDSGTLRLSGGVALVGGRVFLTQPLQGSFLLLRVPGVHGIRGYLSHREMGRTDASGDLLIPNLVAYYGNIVSIDESDVPMDHTFDDSLRKVAPPYRGGQVVRFDVVEARGLTGEVWVEAQGQHKIPAFGELRLDRDKNDWTSPLGKNGEFYFERLADGFYHASVEWEEGTCQFDFRVALKDLPVTNVGAIRCLLP